MVKISSAPLSPSSPKHQGSNSDGEVRRWGSFLVVLLVGIGLGYNLAFVSKPATSSSTSVRGGGAEKEGASTAAPTSNAIVEDTMALWWMSNLRDTPLQMTDDNHHHPPENNNDHNNVRQFIFPPETKTVWVDVGVNVQTDFLPDLERDDSLFVVGFEPSHVWKVCPHKHCAVFWAACTPTYDVVQVNVQSGGDLCNSLLKPNTNTTTPLWRGCVTQEVDPVTHRPKTVQVPGIPLHALVERIPADVDIEYIKIDAQGYDLEVMKGVLPVAPHGRIHVVSLEAMDVTDPASLLYTGQPMFHQVKAFVEEHGWIHVKSVTNQGAKGEINAFFVSQVEYASKVDRLADILMSNKEGKGGRR